MHLVFVYGTLKRGFANEDRMQGARLIGPARTAAGYALYLVDRYPALAESDDPSDTVEGELYRVPDALLSRLDEFEGVPHLYQRRGIPLAEGGTAEAYVMRSDAVRGQPKIADGVWTERGAGRVISGPAE